MTKYLQMNTKTLLKNPYLIFWSILFIEFWVVMWAFVFGNQLPSLESAIRDYQAMAYGNLLMLSLSAAAITIASTLLYSSKSIRFITKYTKLSPIQFILENLVSSLIVLLIISGIMFISILLVFYLKFELVILPVNALGLVFSIVLSNLFIYLLALFLNLLVINLRAPKSSSFITFVPMILAFTSYSALWIDFGTFAYISPFNCITSICYYFIAGKSPPTGNFFMTGEKTLVNMDLIFLSLVLWIILLTIISIVLLKRMRGIGIEEMRTT
ncbi:MAG: hypothetical protein ACTSRS_03715 [Candidatus Helarchaeota archaeon]